MTFLYTLDIDTTEDILLLLARNLRKRRLEKGLSRDALSEISKVPAATITKFETKHTISLASFVALTKALGYTQSLKELLAQPQFNSMSELDVIHKNKNRKRGGRL
ncbi:MAG: helix-turn-helix domain-containing protein [Bacteroides sp.]|nr:helix-turn-helix domain-containing protein [Bacteroides sp.]